MFNCQPKGPIYIGFIMIPAYLKCNNIKADKVAAYRSTSMFLSKYRTIQTAPAPMYDVINHKPGCTDWNKVNMNMWLYHIHIRMAPVTIHNPKT